MDKVFLKKTAIFRGMKDSELDAALKPAVERLLDLKMNVPEVKEIPRVDEINQYLDASIEALKAEIMIFPGEHKPDWEPLNRLFLDEVQKCMELCEQRMWLDLE